MRYRRLGRTGLQISEVGFGAWGIGQGQWVGADDRESLEALDRAIGYGVNFIDTALAYGDGHSEQLVGDAARRSGQAVYIATKVPPKTGRWPGREEDHVEAILPGEWIRDSAERSLTNLATETIDLLQLHLWNDSWLEQGDWQEAVQGLKDEGKIRFFGVSINDHAPDTAMKVVRSGLVDTVQVIYNIFDQSPEDELFAAVTEHDVGVLARVPFDEGGLTGRIDENTVFPAGDWRLGYFGGDRKSEVAERLRSLAADLDVAPTEVPQIALRFVLAADEVSTVIPGMRSIRNVERNCTISDLAPLSPEVMEIVRSHRWVRNWYVYDE
jgi:aryl-alcohol dehydrogenase-like predicted oxidoreductase